jgi:hypothetical protein
MEKTEEIINLIKSTYTELVAIKNEVTFFEASTPFKHNILVIEIALALFELGYFVNRPIEGHEKYWFEGGYYIHYDFDGGWPKLADNYSNIVAIATEKNFFK